MDDYRYVLVIFDKSPDIPSITFDNTKIDFIGIGQAVIGRHFRGRRINLVINKSSYKLSQLKDERIQEWFRHISDGFAKNFRIKEDD
jgi:hypothetical protein